MYRNTYLRFDLLNNDLKYYEYAETLKPFTNEALANKISLIELRKRLQTSKEQLGINREELAIKKEKFRSR